MIHMASPPLAQVYRASPLANPTKEIRLLRLNNNDDGDLAVSVETHSLSIFPDFRAISYTWGDAGNEERILVDGQQLKVGHNCHYALWQARLHYSNSLVWIDAICINQKDNDEKSPQVAIMFDIFSRAKEVLACIGEHDGTSEVLVRRMPEIEEFVVTDGVSLDPSRTSSDSRGAETAQVLEDFISSIGSAVCDLASRPFWSRLWIVQELFAGNICQRTAVLCGHDKLPWSLFDDLYELEAVVSYADLRQFRVVREAVDRYQLSPMIYIIRSLRSYSHGTSTGVAGIWQLGVWDLKCADPLDKIFALMRLVKWLPDAPRPTIDYRQSRLALAKQVTYLQTTPRMTALDISFDELVESEAPAAEYGFDRVSEVARADMRVWELMVVGIGREEADADDDSVAPLGSVFLNDARLQRLDKSSASTLRFLTDLPFDRDTVSTPVHTIKGLTAQLGDIIVLTSELGLLLRETDSGSNLSITGYFLHRYLPEPRPIRDLDCQCFKSDVYPSIFCCMPPGDALKVAVLYSEAKALLDRDERYEERIAPRMESISDAMGRIRIVDTRHGELKSSADRVGRALASDKGLLMFYHLLDEHV
ncbi:hypothetical protein LTR78_002203 [Recurvomyces mirabilis]|uniref:Heterokaryon incompatibility domain-containing protein n=1 Tax=Recurvomyces mirabilis TaxID=574656 RepID=A0AAE1C4W7_9PEZI|nr:hypothetical protein LTR78_002203 [Recurvomyces mirabilis]KAK5160659.1 hypothetical protein LTS14_001671 [Recurvomyces mirabilis]